MIIKPVLLKYTALCLLMLITLSVSAQKKERVLIDSVLRILPAAKADTNKVKTLIKLGRNYSALKKADSAIGYLKQALSLTEKLKWQKGITRAYYYLGYHYYHTGDFASAYNYLNQSFEWGLKGNDDEFTLRALSYASAAIYYQKREGDANNYLLAAAVQFGKRGKTRIEAETYIEVGTSRQYSFHYSDALAYYNKGLKLGETLHGEYLGSISIEQIATLYRSLHNVNKAKAILLKAATAYEKAGNRADMANNYMNLSECAEFEHDYIGAIAYYNKAKTIAEKINNIKLLNKAEIAIGWDYFLMKKYDKAYEYVNHSANRLEGDSDLIIGRLSSLGSIYRDAPDAIIMKAGVKPGQRYEKSVALLTEAINYAKKRNDIEFTDDNLKELSITYEKMNRYADAFKTYKIYITNRDSTDSLKNEKGILLKEAQATYSHKEDSLRYNQNITNAQLKQKKLQSYFFIGGIAALLLLSVFIWRNYVNQRKLNQLLEAANDRVTGANYELSEQREEITSQRDQLMETVANLKTTQQQLIQAEKMASLGELTAGIAHEIQNPLNFVNNFAEVNGEMIAELKEALQAGNMEDASEIVNDIGQNEEKILHHGKRADSIVKGMLEHSRKSTGQKEPTDVNKLADEYLRLAYHGLRAKDKTFNAELVTRFADGLPPVPMIPQDMGRVLLNLFNNAFYATQQKQKVAGAGFKPTVWVTTSLSGSNVMITVRDNGTGIPAAIRDKILQPFFTTKPTGEGTGLGLSLSYDIVAKVHGGSIKIGDTETGGAEFTIQLPIIS